MGLYTGIQKVKRSKKKKLKKNLLRLQTSNWTNECPTDKINTADFSIDSRETYLLCGMPFWKFSRMAASFWKYRIPWLKKKF